MLLQITPVPNAVFDRHLKELKAAELKILLTVIRQTLGWRDKETKSERKESDWISGRQLQNKTGCSQRAISTAIQVLIEKNLIEVVDYNGTVLATPEHRRGQPRLYYKLTSAIFANVEREGTADEYSGKTHPANAKFAEDLGK